VLLGTFLVRPIQAIRRKLLAPKHQTRNLRHAKYEYRYVNMDNLNMYHSHVHSARLTKTFYYTYIYSMAGITGQRYFLKTCIEEQDVFSRGGRRHWAMPSIKPKKCQIQPKAWYYIQCAFTRPMSKRVLHKKPKKPINPNLGFLGFLILLFYFNSF